jgi:hypothetical protein
VSAPVTLLQRAAPSSAVALFALAALATARAEPLDPTLPQRVAVGDPQGAAPMDRIDASRSGRARQRLPARPRVLWRARVGGIDHPLLVDARGGVVAAGSPPHLTQLDARGKLEWTARLTSSPLTSPVITSSGARIVFTSSGHLSAFDASGKLIRRQSLAPPGSTVNAAPLALDDGGLVVALGGLVLRLDAAGGVVAKSLIDDDVRTVLRDTSSNVLLVTARGDVVEWKPPHPPNHRGSFGGKIEDGAALTGPSRVTAVVDRTRLIELKLTTGTRHVRLPDGPLLLRGPPAISTTGESRLASVDGLLLGHDTAGRETLRVALEPITVAPGDAGAPAPLSGGAPPLILDGDGRIGFVRPGLDAGIVTADGETVAAAGAACGDPVALAPGGPRRMAVACRSGLIFMLGD